MKKRPLRRLAPRRIPNSRARERKQAKEKYIKERKKNLANFIVRWNCEQNNIKFTGF
jgi:hypothetical protein